jgi:hypothetical protein
MLRHLHTGRSRVATRTVNRRALRDQNDAAEEVAEDEERDEDSEDGDVTPAPKAKKARAEGARHNGQEAGQAARPEEGRE